MTRPSPMLPVMLGAGLSLVLTPQAASAGWGHLLGDVGSMNRATGSGLITDDSDTKPGISWSVARAPQALDSGLLQDLDGDGVPELLFVASGRVYALSPTSASPRWVTPAQSLDGIVGFGELDGDPTTSELVASSLSVGGGFLVVDPSVGGLVGSLGPFPTLSGAAASETQLADLNGDGIDEVVHPPGRFGVPAMWVSNVADGLANPGFLEVPIAGYANNTPAFVGDFFGTGAPVIAIDQGSILSLYPSCAPSDTGAVCDDGPGDVCLCAGKSVAAHANYTFGPRWVLDTDDDGHDELVQVANSGPYLRAIAVLDFADGDTGGGVLDGDLTRQWYRNYPGLDPRPLLAPLDEGPVDLDGDGDLELVVSFFNNDGGDSDAAGTGPDDGIDNPGGISLAVFDLATGALLASADDMFGWGLADLDGDELPEIVASPTSDFSFQTGVSGWELDCPSSGACSLSTVWESSQYTLAPELSPFNNNSLPPVGVHELDTDLDGYGELLAYDGTTLAALQADGSGGVTVTDSILLTPDERVIAHDPGTNTAAITSNTSVSVIDTSMSTSGVPMRIPSRDWERFQAASFDGGTREPPLFGGQVFVTATAPTQLSQGDLEILPGFGLLEDLDGDGGAEIVSYANPGTLESDDDSFEIRVDQWDSSVNGFVTLWELDSSDHPSLTGFTVGSGLHMATGDFDGLGSRDLVVEVSGDGTTLYLVLDGDTGAIDHEFEPTQPLSTSAALMVADLVDGTGAAAPDGIDDLLVDGPTLFSLHTVQSGELWAADVGNFFHAISGYGDVDGDGTLELIATLSVGQQNQIEVFDGLDSATPTQKWGPSPLPLPTERLQVQATAEVDSAAGVDVLYITGDGGVHALSGVDGTAIAGLPLYLKDGVAWSEAQPSSPNLLALLALDIDDDGYEEAIVGAVDGTIYAVDVATADPDAPGLAWSFDAGAAVQSLAAADTDGDGYQELLVSTDDGRGSVIDGLGVVVEILDPTGATCIPSTVFEVSGESVGIDSVEVLVAGSGISGDVPAGDGTWVADAEVRGSGLFALVARGKDANGVIVAYDSVLITVGEDLDEDGWFACSDCDDTDPELSPGAEDICEDGIDQDCDGQDAVCGDDDDSAIPDDDDDAVDDDDSAVTPPDGCGGCGSCDTSGGPTGPLGVWLLFAVLAVRRRRV